MNGERLDPDQIKAIARLPSREVLYGQLVGVIAHPISGLARMLNQLIGGLAIALGQIQEQGLVGGDAPAPEPRGRGRAGGRRGAGGRGRGAEPPRGPAGRVPRPRPRTRTAETEPTQIPTSNDEE